MLWNRNRKLKLLRVRCLHTHLLRGRLTYFHVAIFADRKCRMSPRKSDRRSKIVRWACVQRTTHWPLSTTIHILANRRLRQTIPMGRSPPPMISAPQSQTKSTIIWPFVCHTFHWTENRMMIHSARMQLFILVRRSGAAHLSNATTINNSQDIFRDRYQRRSR